MTRLDAGAGSERSERSDARPPGVGGPRAASEGDVGAIPPLLRLQRTAGNRAVAAAIRGATVQRLSLSVAGGGVVTDSPTPGANRRTDVEGVQRRLVAVRLLSDADARAERTAFASSAPDTSIPAASMPRTLSALAANERSAIDEPFGRAALRAELVGTVGTAGMNDIADVDLLLNIAHEEWHITNDDYDRSVVAMQGVGQTVDPALLPGFLNSLLRLRRGYVGGWPPRGTIGRRRAVKISDGTREYQVALDRNAQARAMVQGWLDGAAASTRIILRDSIEWVRTGLVKLFVVTMTHDTSQRATGPNRGKLALFPYPRGALDESQGGYRRKLRGEAAYVDENIWWDRPTSGGFQTGTHIGVVRPEPNQRNWVLNTVIHEVQHAADVHPAGDDGSYKTEYNARVAEGRFAGLSDRSRVRALGQHWTERQYRIFRDIWDNQALYPYVRRNWANPRSGAAWRAMIVGYRGAETLNPTNSPRIERLRRTIAACTGRECLEHDREIAAGGPSTQLAALDVIAKLDALDAADRAALSKTGASLKSEVGLHLDGSIRQRVLAVLP